MGKHVKNLCNRCLVQPKGGVGSNKSWCPSCTRSYRQEYKHKRNAGLPTKTLLTGTQYSRDPIAFKIANAASLKTRRQRNQDFVWNYLLSHPCVDCGDSNPIVLEFDHLRDKKANVSRLIALGYALAVLQEEISKCEVVCTSCHRIRTAYKYGSWRTKRLE